VAEIDFYSFRLLRELCMDSRVPASVLASRLGRSRSVIGPRMKFLEDEFGLKYVPELDERKLGFAYPYVIHVKLKKQVDDAKLAELLSASPVPQFAAACKGAFDLLIYATAKNNLDYLRWEYLLRSSLREAISTWEPSQVIVPRIGFFPLREKAILACGLPDLQKRMLVELNRNARIGYGELAKKLGVGVAKVRYHFNLLRSSGVIRRFSAVMDKPPKKVSIVYLSHYHYNEGYESRCVVVRKRIMRDEGSEPCNEYQCVYEMSGYADELTWVCHDDVVEGYERLAEEEKIFEPDEIMNESAVVTHVIYGDWPIRNVDLSKLYDTSSWDDIDEEEKDGT